MRRYLPLLLLILAAPAWADDLGCFVSGGTVPGAFAQFTGTATSVTAGVTDKDDAIASPYATPTMTDRGSNVWTAADITAGATVGLHKIRMTGTVSGATETAIDTFVVAAVCPLTPTVAGRTLDVTAAGEAGLDLDNTAGTLADAEIGDLSGITLASGTHTGAVIPTVTTLTGHTPQTGDSYARLGVPAGASVSADMADLRADIPAALVSGRMDSSTGAMAANVVTAAVVADNTLRNSSEIAVTRCDISASTNGTSFTIATCTSAAGEPITLADGSFAGRMMTAYTNGGAQCNVVGESVFAQTTIAGVVTVRTSTVTGGQGGFTATPSATNCGIYFGS